MEVARPERFELPTFWFVGGICDTRQHTPYNKNQRTQRKSRSAFVWFRLVLYPVHGQLHGQFFGDRLSSRPQYANRDGGPDERPTKGLWVFRGHQRRIIRARISRHVYCELGKYFSGLDHAGVAACRRGYPGLLGRQANKAASRRQFQGRPGHHQLRGRTLWSNTCLVGNPKTLAGPGPCHLARRNQALHGDNPVALKCGIAQFWCSRAVLPSDCLPDVRRQSLVYVGLVGE